MKKGGYTDFDEFVRDVAQIFYNAKFYNSKSSEVFKDAVTLEVPLPFSSSTTTNIDVQKLLAEELQQLQSRGYVETAEIPNLGPLPPTSPISPHSDSPAASDDEDSHSSSSANSDSEPSDDDEDAGAADDDGDEYNEKGVKIRSSTTAAARSTRTRTRRTASLGKLDSADGDEKKEESTRPEDDTPNRGKKRFRGRGRGVDHPKLILLRKRGYGVSCGPYVKSRMRMDDNCSWSLKSCRTRNCIRIIIMRLRSLLRWTLSPYYASGFR